MSKKRTKNRNPNIKMSPKKTGKVHFWDKELNVGQQITVIASGIILIILIFVIIAYFIGHDIAVNQGLDSSEELIKTYLDAIDTHNDHELRRCFTNSSIYGNIDYNTKSQLAKKLADNISVDKSSISIKESEFDDLIDIKNNMKIQDVEMATLSDLTFTATKTVNNMLCSQSYVYKIISFKFNQKWFIYAIQKLSETTQNARWRSNGNQIELHTTTTDLTDSYTIGNGTIGYMNIPTDWTEDTVSAEEFSDYVRYKDAIGSAVVTVATLNSDISEEDFINQVTEKLSESTGAPEMTTRVEGKFAGYDCTIVTSLAEYQTLHFMAWIFKDNSKNPKVHYVEFQYAAANAEMANYVNTFYLK